jgi:antitoxin PrlF
MAGFRVCEIRRESKAPLGIEGEYHGKGYPIMTNTSSMRGVGGQGDRKIMSALEIESTLTNRYQTTVPDAVRRALKLCKRDRIRYVVKPDGAVLLTRADSTDESDPGVSKFLAFLAYAMESNPPQIRGVSSTLVRRARSLVKGVRIDLDAPSPESECC